MSWSTVIAFVLGVVVGVASIVVPFVLFTKDERRNTPT